MTFRAFITPSEDTRRCTRDHVQPVGYAFPNHAPAGPVSRARLAVRCPCGWRWRKTRGPHSRRVGHGLKNARPNEMAAQREFCDRAPGHRTGVVNSTFAMCDCPRAHAHAHAHQVGRRRRRATSVTRCAVAGLVRMSGTGRVTCGENSWQSDGPALCHVKVVRLSEAGEARRLISGARRTDMAKFPFRRFLD
jgi:hypothetical protein